MHVRSIAVVVGCLAVFPVPPNMAAAGSVYYVATDGADHNPGSDSRPWQSIGYAATQVEVGDLVVVQPGTYRETVVLTRSGTEGAPIMFRALPGVVLISPDPGKSLSAFDVGAGVSYIVVEGFDLGGGFDETVFIRPGAHHIELAGLHIHDNHTGIWIDGATDVVVHDAVLDHNYRTGIRIFGGARRVHVLDTRSEANDDGAGCDGESDGFNADDSTSDISFERVSAVGNSQDGFDLQTASSVVRQASTQDNGCAGLKLAAGGYAENVLVERNRTGININGSPDTKTVLQNCTVSQNALGVRALGGGFTLVMRNSIVTGPAKALSYAAGVGLIEDHNIFYRPALSERLIVRMEPNGETLFSGDDVNDGVWQAESGQGQGTIAGDPGFAPGSCAPGPDSVAIDSGEQSAFPPVDVIGTVRPVGNGVDRGAFERVAKPPALQLRRVVLRSQRTGTGRARLDADVSLPGPPPLHSVLAPVSVSIRGDRGEVVHVDVPATAWARSASHHGATLRMPKAADQSPPLQLRLAVSGNRARVRLRARNANVWTVGGTRVDVSVEIGGLRASAEAALRTVGHALTAP